MTDLRKGSVHIFVCVIISPENWVGTNLTVQKKRKRCVRAFAVEISAISRGELAQSVANHFRSVGSMSLWLTNACWLTLESLRMQIDIVLTRV